MSSRHVSSTLKTPSPSYMRSEPTPERPKAIARRSTLKSAEEQLRAIKAGDTTWQQRNCLNSTPEPTSASRPSTSSSTVRSLNGRPSSRQEGDAEPRVRVYLHHVRKTDTLPLILLAYQISAPALKKANRLWATDSIQTRDVLHLPVDECNITPEKCEPPLRNNAPSKGVRRRRREDERIQSDTYNEGSIFEVLEDTSDMMEETNGGPDEEWAMIPGIGKVEVADLPAHKLSYFPTKQIPMERTTSLPTLEALVQADTAMPRDSMDSSISHSSLGSLVEDGVARVVRFWHDNQGKRKWAKIGKDTIEL